jgi:hypothetical protein
MRCGKLRGRSPVAFMRGDFYRELKETANGREGDSELKEAANRELMGELVPNRKLNFVFIRGLL